MQLEANAHHAGTYQLDGLRIGGIEEEHGRSITRAEALLAHFVQQPAHVHGDVAKVDLHRARRLAFVAHGAVVGYILKLFPMADADAAPRLLFIQKRFNQQRRRQNLVARAVQQIGARHVGGTHRLALAAPQAVFDGVGNRADIALLHDQRLVRHQAKRRRVGVGEVGGLVRLAQQLALVEASVRVNARLVVGKRLQLGIA